MSIRSIHRNLNNRKNTSTSHHEKCSSNRENVTKVLKMLRKHNPYNQPCIANIATDHDASRIPADLPHITCPKGTTAGNRCVEIQLPWNVSFYSNDDDGLYDGNNHKKLKSKIIYVPSGCYENVVKQSRN